MMNETEQQALKTVATLLAAAKWKLPPALGELTAQLQKELTALRQSLADGRTIAAGRKVQTLQASAAQLQAAAGQGLNGTAEGEAALRAAAGAAALAAQTVQAPEVRDWLEALQQMLLAMARLCCAPTPVRDNVTSAQAQALCDAVLARARAQGLRLVTAVCDNGGNLLNMRRDDDAFIASIDIAVNKAFTAVALKMPTKQLADLAKPGGSLYGIQHTNNGRIVIFGGGVPIVRAGSIIGGFGVSGASAAQDTEMGDFAAALAEYICAAGDAPSEN